MIPVGGAPPRTVALQGRQAGVVSRFAAAIVDLVVVVIAVGGIYGVWAGFNFLVNPRGFHWPASLGWSIPVLGAVVAGPYLALAWCSSGRTFGDVVLGLRVVTGRGSSPRFVLAVLRAYFCLVFPLGLLWIPFSPSRRSLQDTVLRTMVIYDWASSHALAPRAVAATRPGS